MSGLSLDRRCSLGAWGCGIASLFLSPSPVPGVPEEPTSLPGHTQQSLRWWPMAPLTHTVLRPLGDSPRFSLGASSPADLWPHFCRWWVGFLVHTTSCVEDLVATPVHAFVASQGRSPWGKTSIWIQSWAGPRDQSCCLELGFPCFTSSRMLWCFGWGTSQVFSCSWWLLCCPAAAIATGQPEVSMFASPFVCPHPQPSELLQYGNRGTEQQARPILIEFCLLHLYGWTIIQYFEQS